MEKLEGVQHAGYFKWLARHPSERAALGDVAPEVIGRLWVDAWQAGAWDAIQRNSTLGLNLTQIIERLEELARLYSDVDLDRHVERELERSSTYWRA